MLKKIVKPMRMQLFVALSKENSNNLMKVL